MPEYWVVDLPGGLIEVHTGAEGSRYGQVSTHRRGDTVSPLAFPDVVLRVDDILG